MVTMRDRALIEAKAKGIDIEAALRHPFRQLLKADVVVSAVAVSLMLLFYYTAVGFSVIYLSTVFGFSLKDANGLGNWNWGFNVIAVILIGVLSDRFRVRKRFMLIGGIGAGVMTVVYLLQAGLQPGYYTLAIIVALLSFGLGVAYTPWMASFTETVEARNPALTATGLAIWGWIIRVVVFGSFLLIPVVINSVALLVNYADQVAALATKYKTALDFASAHPDVVALAQKYPTQLAAAQQFKPELTALQTDTVDVGTVFLNCATPNKVPKAVRAKAIAAAGGGATGTSILSTMCQNAAAINGVIKVAPQLQKIAPYAVPLTALSKIPAKDLAYLKAHATDVQNAANKTVGQWKTWYWICFGGIIFFLLSIPLLRGRWRTSDARRDEQKHEAVGGLVARPHRSCLRRPGLGGRVGRARLARAARDRARGAACQVRPVHHDGRLQRGDQPAPVRRPGAALAGRVPVPRPYLPGPASDRCRRDRLRVASREGRDRRSHRHLGTRPARAVLRGLVHLGVAQRRQPAEGAALPQGVGRRAASDDRFGARVPAARAWAADHRCRPDQAGSDRYGRPARLACRPDPGRDECRRQAR